jgi:effector-binding domain-containing protein
MARREFAAERSIFAAMNYTVQAERLASRPIAVVRRKVLRSDLSRVVPELCGLVFATVKAAQAKDIGRQVAVYRSAGDGLLDIEVGVEVGTAFPGRDPVVGSVTPEGTVAIVTHLGPYWKLNEAHQAIREWCASSGRTPAGTNWEVYGHWLDEWNGNPSEIRTDVFYLLKD